MTDFVNEPIDDEERALMDAIENSETHPIPRDELAKIRREIAASSAKNITIRIQNSDIAGFKEKSRLAGHSLPDAHEFRPAPLSHWRACAPDGAVGKRCILSRIP